MILEPPIHQGYLVAGDLQGHIEPFARIVKSLGDKKALLQTRRRRHPSLTRLTQADRLGLVTLGPQLGFDSFWKVGASLGAGKATLGLLGIFGEDVEGGTLVFNYDY